MDSHQAAACTNPLTPPELAHLYAVHLYPTHQRGHYNLVLVDPVSGVTLGQSKQVRADLVEAAAAFLIDAHPSTREWAVAYTGRDGTVHVSHDPTIADPADRTDAETRAGVLRVSQEDRGIRVDATLMTRAQAADGWEADRKWLDLVGNRDKILWIPPTAPGGTPGSCGVLNERSSPVTAELDRLTKAIGATFRTDVDGVGYELRATGHRQWDVYDLAAGPALRGTVLLRASLTGVEWRFQLRGYDRGWFTRPDLDDAIRHVASNQPPTDMPARVDPDPIELARHAENNLTTLAAVLEDADTGWSGDYGTLLEHLARIAEMIGASLDHVHALGTVLGEQHQSADLAALAVRAGMAAEHCGGAAVQAGEASRAADRGLRDLPPAVLASGLLASYQAARTVEACSGRTAADPPADPPPLVGAHLAEEGAAG
jgi:hypothetical protein